MSASKLTNKEIKQSLYFIPLLFSFILQGILNAQRMRIAITVNTSWNIYNFRLGLIKALQEKGHEVYAVAPEDNYSLKLKGEGCIFYKVNMDNKGGNPLNDIHLFFQLRSAYREIQPDIILQYTIKPNIYGTLAARSLGIPVINNVSGLGTVFLHNNFVSKAAKFLYKLAFRYPARVFFQNKDDRDLFLNLKIVSESIAGLVPGSGVDTEKFRPGPFRRNHPFVFLLASRLLYDKGIMEYLEAIKLLKKEGIEADFLLAGGLDTKTKLGIPEVLLKKWIKEGLIKYLEHTDEVAALIHKADCVVLPSYREGTPKSLLEAAACGKPLITTDVPGCREVVDHNKNGFLCKVKDGNDLAAKMRMMLELDEKTLSGMGKQSRLKAEQEFNEQRVIQIYLNEIHRVVKENLKKV